MSQSSSPSKLFASLALLSPMETADLKTLFSKTPAPSSQPSLDDLGVTPSSEISPPLPLSLVPNLNTSIKDSNERKVENPISLSPPTSLPPLDSIMEAAGEKEYPFAGLESGVTIDEAIDGVTLGEPVYTPSSLTPGEVLTAQGLTQMAQGGIVAKISLPTQPFSDLPSLQKWDGTPGNLNILENPAASVDNEDEQPLCWKRKSDQKLHLEKIKEKSVDEEREIQPDVILDQENDKHDEDIYDEVSIGVMMRMEKASKPLDSKEGRSEGSKIVRKSSKRKVAAGSKRKQWEVIAKKEEVIGKEDRHAQPRERRRAGVKGQPLVSDLLSSQEKSNAKIERLTGLLARKEAEIVWLKDDPIEEPGLVVALHQENEDLKRDPIPRYGPPKGTKVAERQEPVYSCKVYCPCVGIPVSKGVLDQLEKMLANFWNSGIFTSHQEDRGIWKKNRSESFILKAGWESNGHSSLDSICLG
ncbi:hypothetical protein HAX54_039426 [Datura stramonium]|uniref:Uncharacterized protein n=1 Tax=Datura stramonium TaxID=4076 RepID=A0ABS8SJD6_DATST|nr:hypothetical protein [Datura stramonium]